MSCHVGCLHGVRSENLPSGHHRPSEDAGIAASLSVCSFDDAALVFSGGLSKALCRVMKHRKCFRSARRLRVRPARVSETRDQRPAWPEARSAVLTLCSADQTIGRLFPSPGPATHLPGSPHHFCCSLCPTHSAFGVVSTLISAAGHRPASDGDRSNPSAGTSHWPVLLPVVLPFDRSRPLSPTVAHQWSPITCAVHSASGRDLPQTAGLA